MGRAVLSVALVLLGSAVAAGQGIAPLDNGSGAKTGVQQPASPAPDASLARYIGKINALATHVRPVNRPAVPTIENTDLQLAAALKALGAMPGARSHRGVAAAYRSAGVLDKAYQHYARAVQLDPSDAEAWDGLARIWRDWGFPHLGLGDAHRAVYHAPRWATPVNTLGTLLLRLGKVSDARAAFVRALELDPNAAYALNNLCYSLALERRGQEAARACERAQALVPGSAGIGNNLALAHAVDGDFVAAARDLGAAGDPASAQYNLGILYLATRQFAAAERTFERAARLRPAFTLAAQRARQSRDLASAARGTELHDPER